MLMDPCWNPVGAGNVIIVIARWPCGLQTWLCWARFFKACGSVVGVLLVSLEEGGVGVDLTAASHVMVMDPCWNPVSVSGFFGGVS
jgi:hypothetical protein